MTTAASYQRVQALIALAQRSRFYRIELMVRGLSGIWQGERCVAPVEWK